MSCSRENSYIIQVLYNGLERKEIIYALYNGLQSRFCMEIVKSTYLPRLDHGLERKNIGYFSH